jgi:protein gp37
MSDNSSIEWTDATWNPVTGCTKVSPGCDHCYAETFAERWRGTPGHHFENGFDVQLRPERLDQPLRWKKPRRIFVNSMSDLFHEEVPDEFIAKVWAVMALAPNHTFQLLTKRHGRMRSLLNSPAFRPACEKAEDELLCDEAMPFSQYVRDQNLKRWWTNFDKPLRNVWLGVSVEDQKRADIRIPALLETPAAVRWISAEPLLGPVDLRNLKARNGALIDCLGGDVKSASDGAVYTGTPSVLDWVVCGGESGPGARPMHPDWARSLRDQCVAAEVPFLFKQWGAWAPTRFVGIGNQGERFAYVGEPVDKNGHRAIMERVGKKAAGRELDGRTWDEYPASATATAVNA